MEIQFWFSLDRLNNAPTNISLADNFRGDTSLVVSYLLMDDLYYGAGACSRPNIFDDFVQRDSQVTLTLTANMINRFYSYAGSDTNAPYSADVRWLVSPYTQSTEILTSSLDWPTGFNYPDRPTPRAIFSEATLMKTDPDNGYFENGCPL